MKAERRKKLTIKDSLGQLQSMSIEHGLSRSWENVDLGSCKEQHGKFPGIIS